VRTEPAHKSLLWLKVGKHLQLSGSVYVVASAAVTNRIALAVSLSLTVNWYSCCIIDNLCCKVTCALAKPNCAQEPWRSLDSARIARIANYGLIASYQERVWMADKILIIDDEKPTADLTAALLKERGFEIYQAPSAQAGLRMAYQHQPDLVLLDVILPDKDGWDVCRQLRELSDMPIILVSATTGPEFVVKGLNDCLADDYVAKPFHDDELVARIKANLRRAPHSTISEELVFKNGDFRINFINREVWIRGKIKHLTPKEFSLLAVLVRNAGRVVSRAELVTVAWGDEYSNAVDSLKLYIHYLRHKLEYNPQQPEYILTKRGVGYRFIKR
jgi:DNA-binding response OmpR family regulator